MGVLLKEPVIKISSSQVMGSKFVAYTDVQLVVSGKYCVGIEIEYLILRTQVEFHENPHEIPPVSRSVDNEIRSRLWSGVELCFYRK